MRGRRLLAAVMAVAATGAVAAPTLADARTAGTTGTTGTAETTGTPQPAAGSAVPAMAIPGLATTINGILADRRLAGTTTAVVVRDARTGEVLYDRNGSRRANPASNEKLLTAAAAMDLLGPGYRFTTTVSRSGALAGGVLTGNLYLRGTGDPTIRAVDYDRLAAAVAAAGVRSVRGYLAADDTAFDAVRLGPSWAWDNEPYAHSAQVSALSIAPDTAYRTGSVAVTVRPTTRGARPAVSFAPASSRLSVTNRATTGAAGTPTTLRVVRRHGSNEFVVTGSVAVAAAPYQTTASLWDPTFVAADVFRAALARRGIRFGAAPVLRRAATPAAATRVAGHSSAPLSSLLVPFLKLSNNAHAEVLVKAIGRRSRGSGSWPAGTAAISAWLGRTGVTTSTIRVADGSGLSRLDLVTATQLTNLLRGVRGKAWYRTWYAALPVAGRADPLVGGTLRSRMRGTAAAGNVRAKTGSLSGVSALSGYVTTAGGRPLVFSILVNDTLAGSVKDLEDRIAVALARSGSTAAGTAAAGGAAAARASVTPLDPGPLTSSGPADDPATELDESQLECSWVDAC